MPVTPAANSVLDAAGRTIKDVLDGATQGSDGSSSIARTIGDIAGSAIPIVGEQKALKDLYTGLTTRDPEKLIGALISLIPVAGGAAKALGKSGSKVVSKVANDVGTKGVKVAALNFQQVAAKTTKALMDKATKDPRFKQTMAKAGEAAYERTTQALQDKLVAMLSEGKLPDLITRDHKSYDVAREAAFKDMGARPDSSWQTLYTEDDGGKKTAVGKHQPKPEPGSIDELYSALGMRFIDADGDRKLMWWKQDDPKHDPVFGVESFQVSDAEWAKIKASYTNQSKSFRSAKRSA